MIYTVTFNPSLDYIVDVEDFQLGKTNRSSKELIYAGGKGLNVSFVLRNLGVDSTAFGFLAGFTGDEIERRVKEENICAEFIHIDTGISRINVKLRAQEESEINGIGPMISESDLEKLYEKLKELGEDDILVLAGSIPSSMPKSAYSDIMKMLAEKNVRIVVDATGELLLNVLEWRPFLVKPNVQELGEIFGTELQSREEIFTYAKKLREKGARNIIVSMAGDGAIFVGENDTMLDCEAPKGKVVNSVGAGDSMVAGFLAGYVQTKDLKEAFATGVSTGSASAFSEGFATKEEMQKLREHLNIKEK